jgi:hypothetical protein
MRISRLPYTIPGQFITAMLGGTMMLGAAGCNSMQPIANGGATNLLGFLINTNTATSVLGALRTADGNEIFVYGTRTPDGNVADVQAAVLRDAQGQEAAVNLEGGFLSKAKSFDGSTLTITYDERSATRVRGRVDIYFASAAPGSQNQSIPFDIDLQQAISQFAAQFEQLTGISLSNVPPPQKPEGGGRPIAADAVPGPQKADDRAQLILVFTPFFVYAFAAAGYVMVQVVAKYLEVMIDTLVGVTQAVIIATCAPFILMGDLLREAGNFPVVGINLWLHLAQAGISVPPRPYL